MKLVLDEPIVQFKNNEAVVLRDWLTSTKGSAWDDANTQGVVIERFRSLLDKALGAAANGS